MKVTTFDYAKALRGNHAVPHGTDIDGKTTKEGMMELNYSVIPMRPSTRPGAVCATCLGS